MLEIGFTLPPEWTHTFQDETVYLNSAEFQNSDPQPHIWIEALPNPHHLTTLDLYNRRYARLSQQDNVTLEPVTVNGLPAFRSAFTVLGDNSLGYFIPDGDRTLQISLTPYNTETPSPEQDRALEQLETLLATFTLLNPQPVLANDQLWTRYSDSVLNFSSHHPVTWSASHQHGATIFRDEMDQPALIVRDYLTRGGVLSAEMLINRILPPNERVDLVLTPTEFNSFTRYNTASTTFIAIEGRLLSFVATEGNEAALEKLLQTLSAKVTKFNGNYTILSSENWIAKVLRGGANPVETFTVQQRDGSDGYLVFTEPAVEGLGYDLIVPHFFTSDERYLYYQNRGVSDGCGLFLGAQLERVDLSDGTHITLDGATGSDPALSADESTIALIRNRWQEAGQLILYTIETGAQRSIDLPLTGERPAAGGLLWSPDDTQVAFAFAEGPCGENWSIGVVDLATEATTFYPMLTHNNQLAFYTPSLWLSNGLELQNGTDIRAYLDFESGEAVLQE